MSSSEHLPSKSDYTEEFSSIEPGPDELSFAEEEIITSSVVLVDGASSSKKALLIAFAVMILILFFTCVTLAILLGCTNVFDPSPVGKPANNPPTTMICCCDLWFVVALAGIVGVTASAILIWFFSKKSSGTNTPISSGNVVTSSTPVQPTPTSGPPTPPPTGPPTPPPTGPPTPPPTPTYDWVQYSLKNAYDDHGGDSIDGDTTTTTVSSVEDCEDTCLKNANCECVTLDAAVASGGSGKCYLRQNCDPSNFATDSGFNVYVYTEVTPAPPPTPPTPPPPPPPPHSPGPPAPTPGTSGSFCDTPETNPNAKVADSSATGKHGSVRLSPGNVVTQTGSNYNDYFRNNKYVIRISYLEENPPEIKFTGCFSIEDNDGDTLKTWYGPGADGKSSVDFGAPSGMAFVNYTSLIWCTPDQDATFEFVNGGTPYHFRVPAIGESSTAGEKKMEDSVIVIGDPKDDGSGATQGAFDSWISSQNGYPALALFMGDTYYDTSDLGGLGHFDSMLASAEALDPPRHFLSHGVIGNHDYDVDWCNGEMGFRPDNGDPSTATQWEWARNNHGNCSAGNATQIPLYFGNDSYQDWTKSEKCVQDQAKGDGWRVSPVGMTFSMFIIGMNAFIAFDGGIGLDVIMSPSMLNIDAEEVYKMFDNIGAKLFWVGSHFNNQGYDGTRLFSAPNGATSLYLDREYLFSVYPEGFKRCNTLAFSGHTHGNYAVQFNGGALPDDSWTPDWKGDPTDNTLAVGFCMGGNGYEAVDCPSLIFQVPSSRSAGLSADCPVTWDNTTGNVFTTNKADNGGSCVVDFSASMTN